MSWLWSCVVIFLKGLVGMWTIILSVFVLTLLAGFTYQALGGNLEDTKDKIQKKKEEYTGKSKEE